MNFRFGLVKHATTSEYTMIALSPLKVDPHYKKASTNRRKEMLSSQKWVSKGLNFFFRWFSDSINYQECSN